jgi:hypothetical protein
VLDHQIVLVAATQHTRAYVSIREHT